MRFPQFSRSFVRRARGLSFSVVAVSFGFAFACSNEHLGRPCDPGTPAPAGTAGGQIVTVASPALECPSHICVGATNPQGTGALCSAGCESSADCADGEIGQTGNPSDTRCKDGFVCLVPTTVGDFACQKLCVCRDFVVEPPGGFQKPAACP